MGNNPLIDVMPIIKNGTANGIMVSFSLLLNSIGSQSPNITGVDI